MTTRREMLAAGAALAASGMPAIASSPGRFRVAVLGDYEGLAVQAPWDRLGDDVEVSFFGKPFESARAAASALRNFDALVLMRERTPLSRATLERLPRLKLIVSAQNNQTLDYAAAVEHHITVSSTSGGGARRPTPPAVGGDAPAEMALALMMACARKIPAADALVRRGGWAFEPGTTLKGKTLGIVGYGNLGRQVGRYGLALGMTVLGWSRSFTDEMAQADGVSRAADLPTLLRSSDVVSIHLPLTPATRGIVGTKELALMKPGVMFINSARAAIVDQAAMIAALRSQRISMAGLDVFDPEPLPKGHPLLQLSNVVLTPHLGYSIGPALVNMYAGTIEVVASFRKGVVLNPYIPNDPNDLG